MKYRSVAEVLTENAGRWLTARELFTLLEQKDRQTSIGNALALSQVLRRFHLLARRKGKTRGSGMEREYFCEEPRINPN